jgi:hypothetical protein
MKNIGYDEKIGKDFKKLKVQLEVMQHLTTNYPIRYIKAGDLEKLYRLYEKNTPGIDKIIAKVVEENKNATGIHSYVGTAFRVRKGYPLFDQYGHKLTLPKEELYMKDKIKAEEKGELNGFGDVGGAGTRLLGPLLLVLFAFLYFKN